MTTITLTTDASGNVDVICSPVPAAGPLVNGARSKEEMVAGWLMYQAQVLANIQFGAGDPTLEPAP